MKKKWKKAKWLSEDNQIAVKRREAKGKGEKERYKQTFFSNNSRDDSTHGHHQMVNTKSDCLYSLQPKMQKLYAVNKNKTER